MNEQLKIWNLIISILAVVVMNSCSDDPPLPDNLATFEAAAIGFEGTETDVKVTLSREEGTDIALVINLAPSKLTYGSDFTTAPAATSNKITLTIPAGSTEASFKVTKPSTVFLNGDESIDFTIESATEPVLLGETPTTKLSFSAITSEGSTLTLQGKTDVSVYANSVYVDLSGNKQTPVDRKSWNLGFYTGSDFKVILNPNFQTTAAPLTKTDISTVTLADAETVQNLNHNLQDPNTISLADSWDGDMNKLVFANVSATESENKVYLVSFEGNKDKDKWYKVKVNRNGAGYKVQYALIGDANIKTLDVAKDANYNFSFVSLVTNNVVAVEPYKSSWDLAWSYSTYNSGLATPYWFQDFVLLNYLGGAQAAEVVSVAAGSQTAADVSAEAYSSFAEGNISNITFLSSRDAIGSKWRNTSGSAVGIKRDRFYVVKDPSGNVYKMKFVSAGIGSDGGERGKPVIEYKLVKKAS